MASIAGPIAPPLSPGMKRSTRKRQRPTFFAEEMAATPPPASSRKHSSSGQRSTRPRQGQTSSTPTTSSSPAGRPRSELSELHETVAGLRVQIESATEQMQELRSLVTMLADLYRRDQERLINEPALFSATSSEQSSHETDEMFSTTASEYDHDAAYDDNDDESLSSSSRRQRQPPADHESFADAALQRNAGRERGPNVDLSWIPSTSNDVERLFSRAGIVFSSLRRAMSPTTLETLLYLQYNRVWWDASAVSQGIGKMKEKKKQRVE